MFKRLLIANRGEIAIRIARTAEAMGIETIALYSEDDETALHRLRATRDLALSGSGPAAYLDQAQILDLARECGADAIHPGYGFLSENADFAALCAAEGIRFIGPHPDALRLFGDKAEARALAQRCGVPVPLGTDGGAGPEAAAALFDRGVAALMVKAVSCGGGRGMRLVETRDRLEAAMHEAGAEALAAIGLGDVYVEEFIPDARHIEIQVIGDGKAVTHAGERECTLQRRHQKVIEFAPSPHLDPALRAQMIEAALTMARAVGYQGLGTFEFLVSNDPAAARPFAFIECNPRLQVEHTVTEQVMGVDLVEAQIAIAAGRSLADLGLADLGTRAPDGAALQLRLSVDKGAAGNRIDVFDLPGGPGVRCDVAGYTGYRPSPRFDPLIGKIIVHEPRGRYPALLAKTRRMLAETRIEGLPTNLGLLRGLLAHPAVTEDRVDTEFMDRAAAELVAPATAAPRFFAAPLPGAEADLAPTRAIPEGCTAVPAPLAGSVVHLHVGDGDLVGVTSPVAVIEAMKMQNTVLSGVNGIVRRLACDLGDVLGEADPILYVEPSDAVVLDDADSVEIDLDQIPASLEVVRAARARIFDEARPAAVEKLRKRGKPTTRQNLAALCDAGSFLEIGSLTVSTMGGTLDREVARGISPADGLVCGHARINSELFGPEAARCIVLAFDPSVSGGTMGKIAKDKIERVMRIAKAGRLPIVFIVEGGGARSGESESDIRDGTAKMEVFRLFAELKGHLPLVGIVAGNCFAGHAAFAGMCDVIIATPEASIGMAGPAMIEGAGLGRYAAREIGPAGVHSRTGVIDILVDSEAEAMSAARKYLSYFQGNSPDISFADQRLLRHVVPLDRTHVYDMRHAIALVADTGSFTELRAEFGRAVITGFLRVEGMPLGVLASNPRHMGGAIDAEASDKAAHFMQHCNAFGLPIVSFVDTPGFMVGPAAEQEALVRRVSRIFIAGAQLQVPLFTCVLRKCYGLGGVAMNGGSQSTPLTVVAWPTGEFGAMNPEGSVEIAHKRELAAIADPEERAALVRKYADAFYEYGTALNMAKTGKFDEVIDPVDTRHWIATGLRASRGRGTAPIARPYLDTW